jgi:glutamate 5-kinase
MATKIEAAGVAAAAGIPVLLAAAEDAHLALAVEDPGPKVGTAFASRGQRLSARRFWLRHAADVRGRLDLDAGAVDAVVRRRRSLLAAGVHGVSGDFVAGDVVDLVGPHGVVVARGVVGFDAAELPALIGRRTRDLPPEYRRELVHADDLVPLR